MSNQTTKIDFGHGVIIELCMSNSGILNIQMSKEAVNRTHIECENCGIPGVIGPDVEIILLHALDIELNNARVEMSKFSNIGSHKVTKRLCGCKEKCFERGKERGHLEGIMCKYLGSESKEDYCRKFNDEVKVYTTNDEYVQIQLSHKMSNPNSTKVIETKDGHKFRRIFDKVRGPKCCKHCCFCDSYDNGSPTCDKLGYSDDRLNCEGNSHFIEIDTLQKNILKTNN